MPQITDFSFTATKIGTDVRLDVWYSVFFSFFEGNMVKLGLGFADRIEIIGVDPPGSYTGTTLVRKDWTQLPVQGVGVGQVLNRAHTLTVPRVALDEDPDVAAPNADELRCKIIISSSIDQLMDKEVFTNQVVLSGGPPGVGIVKKRRRTRR